MICGILDQEKRGSREGGRGRGSWRKRGGMVDLLIVIVKATLSKINDRRSRCKQLMIEVCNDVKRA